MYFEPYRFSNLYKTAKMFSYCNIIKKIISNPPHLFLQYLTTDFRMAPFTPNLVYHLAKGDGLSAHNISTRID